MSKFNKNRREKKKKGERKSRGISVTLLPKFLCSKCYRSVKKKAIAVMPLPKKEKIKIKIVLAIVAMPLPKMEK